MSEIYQTRLTLLQRARDQKDSRAWEELVNFYKNYIYAIVKSMSINNADAEDILQHVIVKMWKALPEFKHEEGKKRFRSWIARITKNEVYMFIRKEKSRAKTLDKSKQDATVSYLDTINLPEVDEIAEREWKLFVTNKAFEMTKPQFTERAIEAFELNSKGVKVKEIALKMNLTERAIYQYISKVQMSMVKRINQLKKDLDF